ncbi:MAG: hypothetical protein AAGF35_10135 [Pseudomonadota bacterium]
MIGRVSVTLPLLALACNAAAHFPTLQCRAQTGGAELYCQAGFSDGTPPGEVELRVFTYDEELIKTVVTDAEGRSVMTMPDGEFFIIFDASHETPAEFDYAELDTIICSGGTILSHGGTRLA